MIGNGANAESAEEPLSYRREVEVAKKTARRVKHVPQRTCVGCRQIMAKRALIRVVRTPEGLRVDPTGKNAGRGAYLHDNRACWERGLKNALSHALKVELSEEDRETLRTFMASLPETDLNIENNEGETQGTGPGLTERKEIGTSGNLL
jgi:uncharacterized protein